MVDISNLEAAKIQERLLKDDDVWWALINLDLSSSKPKAIVAATGNGGVEQLKQNMADDLVQYGAVKVLGVDVKGAVTSTRLKIIFFQWVSDVAASKRFEVHARSALRARSCAGCPSLTNPPCFSLPTTVAGWSQRTEAEGCQGTPRQGCNGQLFPRASRSAGALR